MKKLTIFILILFAIFIIYFTFSFFGIDLSFLPACGSYSTGFPFPEIKCSCIGIPHTPFLYGGATTRCIGFCLKDNCKVDIRDPFKEERVIINCDLRGEFYKREKKCFAEYFSKYSEECEKNWTNICQELYYLE